MLQILSYYRSNEKIGGIVILMPGKEAREFRAGPFRDLPLKSIIKIMKTISFLTLLVIFSLTFIGCEKKDDPISGKTELLTSHTWNFDKLTTTSTDPDTKLVVSLMSLYMSSCNNTIEFSTNGTYTWLLEEDYEFGTWSFRLNETEIFFDIGTDEFFASPIIELTSTIFAFEFTDPDSSDIIFHWAK